jgi:hypothetical protein
VVKQFFVGTTGIGHEFDQKIGVFPQQPVLKNEVIGLQNVLLTDYPSGAQYLIDPARITSPPAIGTTGDTI